MYQNNRANTVKVKVFDSGSSEELESEVNYFLASNDINIIDIKYSGSTSVSGEQYVDNFSVLIIYTKI